MAMRSNDPALEGINLDDDFGAIDLDQIQRVNDFARINPHLGTVSKHRADIFNSANNRLDEFQAILRVGRTVYIVVTRYKAWLLSHAPERIRHPTPSLKPAAANVFRLRNANKTQRGGRHDR
jgi:hypothetical protein